MEGQTTKGQMDSHSDYNADLRVLQCLRVISGEMLTHDGFGGKVKSTQRGVSAQLTFSVNLHLIFTV